MTTIVAYRPTLTMVADTKISHGEGSFKSTKKISRVGPFLVGLAGEYGPGLACLRAFTLAAREADGQTPPLLPPFTDDFELLVLSKSGLWLFASGGDPIEIEEDWYGIGTGGSFAAASLRTQELTLQPCNLELAVEIACEFDPNSALPAVTLTLKSRKKTRDTA